MGLDLYLRRGQVRRGRPAPAFIWALPKLAMLGDKVMPAVVKVLRTTPPAGKQPFLLRRWNSPASSPGNATAWTYSPLSQSQASTGTLAVMRNALGEESPKWKERPLPSYVARRFPSTVAGQMGMSARLRGTLGNWRKLTDKDV